MMNAATDSFSMMAQSFSLAVTELKDKVVLQTAPRHAVAGSLTDVSDQLSRLEQQLKDLETATLSQEVHNAQMREITGKLHRQSAKVRALKKRVPEEDLRRVEEQEEMNKENFSHVDSTSLAAHGHIRPGQQQDAQAPSQPAYHVSTMAVPLSNVDSRCNKASHHHEQHVCDQEAHATASSASAQPSVLPRGTGEQQQQQQQARGQGSTASQAPLQRHVTADEIAKLPSYLKIRVSTEKLNGFLDDMARIAAANSKLMRMAWTKVAEDDKKRYEDLRAAKDECSRSSAAAAGAAGAGAVAMVQEAQLRGLSLAAQVNKIMPVLKHLGRVSEVRIKSCRTYVLLR